MLDPELRDELLVQHADHGRDVQRRCLPLPRAVARGQAAPRHLAYLAEVGLEPHAEYDRHMHRYEQG
ncbi:hypothetical protein AB0K40_35395 [Nonomuraea bangladeshensis]|uniref:Uncharacterized protein n=1 Tax=Nonomuraea bangladeshensis TaxID=404385 RepID=A0ABV3HEL7_9ACTN